MSELEQVPAAPLVVEDHVSYIMYSSNSCSVAEARVGGVPPASVSSWAELSRASCSRLICSILDSFGAGGAGKDAVAGEDAGTGEGAGAGTEETYPSNRSSKLSKAASLYTAMDNAPTPTPPLWHTIAQHVLKRG